MNVEFQTYPSRLKLHWLLAVLFTLSAGVVYEVFVRTAWGHGIEDAALAGRTLAPGRILGGQLTFLDVVSVGSLALAAALLIAIAVLRRRPLLALAAGAMILGSNVATQVLKQIALVRPDYSDGAGFLNNSFPSGHATVAMSVAVALILVVPSRFRWVAAFLGLAYAAITGSAVVSVGWHRPSDVLGAWLVVGAFAALSLAVLTHAGQVPIIRPIRRTIVATLGFFAAVVAMSIALVIVSVIAVDAWFVGESFIEIRRSAAFIAGSVATVGSAALVIGVLLAALGGTSIGYRVATPARPTEASQNHPELS